MPAISFNLQPTPYASFPTLDSELVDQVRSFAEILYNRKIKEGLIYYFQHLILSPWSENILNVDPGEEIRVVVDHADIDLFVTELFILDGDDESKIRELLARSLIEQREEKSEETLHVGDIFEYYEEAAIEATREIDRQGWGFESEGSTLSLKSNDTIEAEFFGRQ